MENEGQGFIKAQTSGALRWIIAVEMIWKATSQNFSKNPELLLALLGMNWDARDVPGPGLCHSQLLGTLWQLLTKPPAWGDPGDDTKDASS